MTSEGKLDRKRTKPPQPEHSSPARRHAGDTQANAAGLATLQQRIGNRAVQRLVARRSGRQEAFTLDRQTANRIDQERGRGHPLEGTVQRQMGQALGQDLSGVRVHTSPEADALNRQLGAKAFTTGQDVFFREGAYRPHSGEGQELLAHELTHVVDQREGRVKGGGSEMTVHPPDDAHEQRADAVSKQVAAAGTGAQRAVGYGVPTVLSGQGMETSALQRQELPEEEELQTKALQRQEIPEEELETKALQRQELPEEEELQTKALQRQELPEEELQTKALQRKKS